MACGGCKKNQNTNIQTGNKSAPTPKAPKFNNGDKVYKAQPNGKIGNSTRIQYTPGYIDTWREVNGLIFYVLQGGIGEIDENHLMTYEQAVAATNAGGKLYSIAE